MKIVITLLIAVFLVCSCKKNNTTIDLIISFKSDAPILFAQYNVRFDDHEFYHPSIWPNGGGVNFPYTPLEEISNNLYEVDFSVDISVSEFLGIYTKTDVSSLSGGETASYEITIVDQQTGEIKYERTMETTAAYNRELIQL
ncbi:MAG: hypothetical protein ACQERC_04020 [Bacteroidota bacterium]